MKNKQKFQVMVVVLGFVFLVGCGGGGSGTNNPNRGFDLLPNRIEISQTTGSVIHRPTIMRVISTFLEPQGTTQGTIEFFPATDIGPAVDNFPGAKVPAKWRFEYVEIGQVGRIPCHGGMRTVERNVHVGELERLDCEAYVFPIAISPNTADVNSPPASIEIDVAGISDLYGNPQVAILNEFGVLRDVVSSTVVSLTKGRIAITVPNLSSYPNGVYQITVSNVNAAGGWEILGAGELSVYGNTPPPPPNFPDPCSIPAPCLF